MNTFKFIFLSLIGFIIFIVPFNFNGTNTVFISHFNSFVSENFGNYIILMSIVLQLFVIVGSVIGLVKKEFKSEFLNKLLVSNKLNFFLKISGSITFLMIIFKVGPAFILSEDTGQTAFDLVITLYVTFFAGIMLLPLITKFGAVEFIGVLVSKFMMKFFKVPGYAAIDTLASFVGDGTIGIVVTEKQYLNGYYTQREAVTIASCFSIVGISFAAVVAEELGFSEIFGIFYFTIFLVTIILAVIISRLPMKKFKTSYYGDMKPDHKVLLGDGSLRFAFKRGCEAAKKVEILSSFKEAFVHVGIIYFTFIPVIMFVGTMGLVLTEYTPIFKIISIPLIPVLQILGFTKQVATEVAPAMFVGFADMYLPSMLIKASEFAPARFFVGVLSFSQLIFLSETGMIMVNSKIGFNFWDILKIFIIRTILATPIILIITNFLILIKVIPL